MPKITVLLLLFCFAGLGCMAGTYKLCYLNHKQALEPAALLNPLQWGPQRAKDEDGFGGGGLRSPAGHVLTGVPEMARGSSPFPAHSKLLQRGLRKSRRGCLVPPC